MYNGNLGTTVLFNCGDLCLNCTRTECVLCELGLYLINGICYVTPPSSQSIVPSNLDIICVDNILKEDGTCM